MNKKIIPILLGRFSHHHSLRIWHFHARALPRPSPRSQMR